MTEVTPRPKKSTKVVLIVSIASAIVAIAALVGIGLFVTTFFRASGDKSSDYSAAVQMVESANKSFAAGDVAKVGPYDVTTTSIQKDYMPSQIEADAIQKAFTRAQRSTSSPKPTDYYGYSLTQETGHYVLVTLNLKYNETRAHYDDLQFSQGNWGEQFSEVSLNEMVPLVVSPNTGDYQTSKKVIADAASGAGATLTLLYRLPKTETALTLHYGITLFTKVSSFVGTEGMPRKEYEYTIGIQ